MLEANRLVWSRPGTRGAKRFALRIPRLTVGKGVTLLVGRNGAGKSSLLHLLGTAQLPDEGAVTYDGLTIERDLPAIRASIGFVPTGVELYDEMTAVRLMRYVAQLKGVAATAEIDRLLAAFRLEDSRNRKIKTLAQGVRQRIALAQAWIGSPEYLFLDEPLNALDSLERLRFIRMLAEYARARTAIVSTHELNEWEAWAQRIVWIDEGAIRFQGATAEWTQALPADVWEGDVPPDGLQALDPDSVLNVRAEGGRLRVRVISPQPPTAAFERQCPTLEDAYFIRCRAACNAE